MQARMPILSPKNRLLLYLAPLLLFVIAAAVLYRYFQYRIVSDDISYLAIARRYLAGDYSNAVNGYWSPLNTWLLALLLKITGWNILPAAYVLNCASFAGVLLLSITLCRKFIKGYFELFFFGLGSALFWAANIPVTRFADALNCFLLLACLLLLLRRDFLQRKGLWLVYGLLSAIAYFSKAYSFYIIPLSTAVIVGLQLKQQDRLSLKRWLGIICSTTISMLLFSLPWLLLLHEKYGAWLISTAGGINTNWAVKGHMYFSDQYAVLVPPAYADGLSCWEDPWINHGIMISPLGSPSLMGKQLFRIAMNILQWFKVTAEYSPFYFPVWIAGLFYLFRHKIRDYEPQKMTLIVAFLLFPAGYLMLSFGTRYLWFTVPLVMISGLLLSRQHLLPLLQQKLYRLFIVVYCLSWLPGAVSELKATLNEGKADFELAAQLQDMQISGSFITNNYAGYQNHFRISWFSGNPFYMHFGDQWNTATLLREGDKLQVKYYYYFYECNSDDYVLTDAAGKPYSEVTGGKIIGLKVFQLR